MLEIVCIAMVTGVIRFPKWDRSLDMYNCVRVVVNGKCSGIFPDIDKAEMYRQLMQQQFAHLNLEIHCDWAYIDGLVF